MRTGLVQITSSDDPVETLPRVLDGIDRAVDDGAGFVLTPEVTNCVSASRSRQAAVLALEQDDRSLAAFREAAARHDIWLLVGSLGLKLPDDTRFANRSFLIGPDGAIVARYDKVHMFDVEIDEKQTYCESDGFRPGDRAVVADAGFAGIGLSICYDLRFPHLYRSLAHAGATVLTVPSAFTTVSGAAHWHSLLRARAIENGAWVLAPAQTGAHPASRGRQRESYGHSLAVDPWGEITLDMGEGEGTAVFDMDLTRVTEARRRIPAILNDRPFAQPAVPA